MPRRHKISNDHPHIRKLKRDRKPDIYGKGRWACHGPWLWAYGETSEEAYNNFKTLLKAKLKEPTRWR
jgi:hypothetical protein